MTSTAQITADYNPIAGFYQRHWSNHYHPWAVTMLDKVLCSRLARSVRVLDLCCGNGIIAKHLAGLGYRVTGLDRSEGMLRFAKRNSPDSCFVAADARNFELSPVFDGAISTFDSMNHILLPEELTQVFRNVCACLRSGGLFVFDINLEESYREAWNRTCSIIREKHAFFIRGDYDAATRLGRTEITVFEENGAWSRTDVTLLQRFYPAKDVVHLLREAGFKTARARRPIEDLGITGDFGKGRAVFVAEK